MSSIIDKMIESTLIEVWSMRDTVRAKSAMLAVVFSMALMTASFVQALSLGDIHVSSAVGERFYGIIKINDVRRIPADRILASIAPRSIYQRMGVDWEYFHAGLIFDVVSDERQGVYIRIVSSDAVYEPYLDFVLSLRWPSGYMTKQYTVLLDMPTRRKARSTVVVKPLEAVPIAPDLAGKDEATKEIANEKPRVTQKSGQFGSSKPVVVAPSVVAIPDITAAVNTASNVTSPKITDELSLNSQPAESISDSSAEQDQEVETAAPKLSNKKDLVVGDGNVVTDLPVQKLAKETSNDSTSTVSLIDETTEQANTEETGNVELELPVPEPVVLFEEPSGLEQDEVILDDTQRPEIAVPELDVLERSTEEGESTEVKQKASLEAAVVDGEVDGEVDEADESTPPKSIDPVNTDGQSSNEAVIEQEVVEAQPIDAEPTVIEDIDESESDSVIDGGVPQWDVATIYGDTLWGIARRIRAQSGGRTIDIVNALHRNNTKAFIRNDMNRLRADANLRVTMAQIRAATPVSKRNLLNVPDAQAIVAEDASRQPVNVAVKPTVTDTQDGVLSLVTQDVNDEAVSQEVATLAQRLKERNEKVDAQQASNFRATESVEEGVDNLMDQYRVLSEKTRQLKELESELNRSIAEKAQVEMGLAPAIAVAPKIADSEKTLAIEKSSTQSLWLWLLALMLLAAAVILSVWYLRRRQVIREIEAIKDWDNDLFLPQGELETDELSDTVELKGEAPFLRPLQVQEMADYISFDADDGSVELQAGLYIAYERYDDAERLLDAALTHRPDNITLKSHMLEVYAAQGRLDKFDELADELKSTGSDQLIKKINALRG